MDLKLFSIQVLGHAKYSNQANEQYWDRRELPAKRGSIYSSDGQLLAGTQTHYLLYGEPNNIDNKYEVAHELSEVLNNIKKSGSEPADFYDFIYDSLNKDLMWVPLARNLTPPQRDQILELDLDYIGFEDAPVRYYPEDSLAAHILGFVASNEAGEKVGYYGIEGALNEDLKGRSGRIMEETDAIGTPILVGSYERVAPVEGRDLVLTIDSAVQYLAEKKIKEGVEKYEAVSGSVIIMDPFTGAIIAMANYPTYEPDDFLSIEEVSEDPPYRKNIEKRNLAIQQIYEPGSVIKPLTVAAAIDLKLLTPESTFEDNGPVWYDDYQINNWDGNHHGTQTIIQLLQKSNNIGAAWVGHQVGSKKLSQYFKDFGLGERTNIDLEGEDTGIIHDYKTWADIDLATAAFGQGISATPLQVLNAFNTLANGGFLLEPRIIKEIIEPNKTIDIPPKTIRRVISKDTSDTMVWMLEEAAAGGEAKYFVLKDYKIAGKTGTAQIPEEGKYSPDKTNATFVGFLSDPKTFSMIVKLEEPHTSTYAAETAVPLWMDLASELVVYYGVPPIN